MYIKFKIFIFLFCIIPPKPHHGITFQFYERSRLLTTIPYKNKLITFLEYVICKPFR